MFLKNVLPNRSLVFLFFQTAVFFQGQSFFGVEPDFKGQVSGEVALDQVGNQVELSSAAQRAPEVKVVKRFARATREQVESLTNSGSEFSQQFWAFLSKTFKKAEVEGLRKAVLLEFLAQVLLHVTGYVSPQDQEDAKYFSQLNIQVLAALEPIFKELQEAAEPELQKELFRKLLATLIGKVEIVAQEFPPSSKVKALSICFILDCKKLVRVGWSEFLGKRWKSFAGLVRSAFERKTKQTDSSSVATKDLQVAQQESGEVVKADVAMQPVKPKGKKPYVRASGEQLVELLQTSFIFPHLYQVIQSSQVKGLNKPAITEFVAQVLLHVPGYQSPQDQTLAQCFYELNNSVADVCAHSKTLFNGPPSFDNAYEELAQKVFAIFVSNIKTLVQGSGWRSTIKSLSKDFLTQTGKIISSQNLKSGIALPSFSTAIKNSFLLVGLAGSIIIVVGSSIIGIVIFKDGRKAIVKLSKEGTRIAGEVEAQVKRLTNDSEDNLRRVASNTEAQVTAAAKAFQDRALASERQLNGLSAATREIVVIHGSLIGSQCIEIMELSALAFANVDRYVSTTVPEVLQIEARKQVYKDLAVALTLFNTGRGTIQPITQALGIFENALSSIHQRVATFPTLETALHDITRSRFDGAVQRAPSVRGVWPAQVQFGYHASEGDFARASIDSLAIQQAHERTLIDSLRAVRVAKVMEILVSYCNEKALGNARADLAIASRDRAIQEEMPRLERLRSAIAVNQQLLEQDAQVRRQRAVALEQQRLAYGAPAVEGSPSPGGAGALVPVPARGQASVVRAANPFSLMRSMAVNRCGPLLLTWLTLLHGTPFARR